MKKTIYDQHDNMYEFSHVVDDDSRRLVDCKTGKVVFTIDSSLNVINADGKYIGIIRTMTVEEEAIIDRWCFMPAAINGIGLTTKFTCNKYDWKQLWNAEVAVVEYLLGEAQ